MDPAQFQQLLQTINDGQANLNNAVGALAQAMTALTNQVNTLAQAQAAPPQVTGPVTVHQAAPPARDNSVQKPTPYDGKTSQDARHFLAAFPIYAMTLREMNREDPQNPGTYHRIPRKWIMSALTFLQDEAAVWATPYLETLAAGNVVFNDNWDEFVTGFKARFESVDEKADAKDALRRLRQGNGTVAEYLARFKELKGRTGYSDDDLRDRFYENLSSQIKDELVHTGRPIGTLDELSTVSMALDNRIRERKAEKAQELARLPIHAPRTQLTPTPAARPFTTPRDPNTMDIDAARTREAFLKHMSGKCFGCGSTTHSKRTCVHAQSLCPWCARTGHREEVCEDKFRGKPKKAAVIRSAVVEEAPEAGPSNAPTRARQDELEAQIAAMKDGQKALEAQIAALKASF